jgi:hypothetical protein
VRVCKRDGRRLGAPQGAPPGAALKLMVYGRRPLHDELVRRLRRAGAAGATTLRGVCEVVPRMTVQRNLATAARLEVEVNRTGRP